MGWSEAVGHHVVVHEGLIEGHAVEEAVREQPARGDGDGSQIDLADDIPHGVDPLALGRGVVAHGDVSRGVGLDAGGGQIEALGERLAADGEEDLGSGSVVRVRVRVRVRVGIRVRVIRVGVIGLELQGWGYRARRTSS